ncbi:MAG: VCBS repeat-containing protein [Fibrobacter sp.]|nr:VCBS repeat-containing protein [Fibrobacter sp.]
MMKFILLFVICPYVVIADFVRLSCVAPSGETRDLKVGLWAWPVPMDWDGDGDIDLLVSCPCRPYNGTYLFRNPGGVKPVFAKGERIADGFWNVVRGNSMRNGANDVFMPGVRHHDFPRHLFGNGRRFGNIPDNVHSNSLQANIWREVDFDGDGMLDILVGTDDWEELADALWGSGMRENYASDGRWIGPPNVGNVYFVRRESGDEASPVYAAPEPIRLENGEPLVTEGNPMPMCEDWDGDGDLDIICGCYVNTFTWFENIGTRTAPIYASGRPLCTKDGLPLEMDLAMITPSAFDWDGDGRLDIICGDEDGRVAFIRGAGVKGQPPWFEKPYYFRQEADDLNFGVLSTPCGVDWDGDGDWDILCGNSAGEIGFIENLSGAGVALPRWAEPVRLKAGGRTICFKAGLKGSIQGPVERNWGYTCLSAADWDGDGLPDLMVNTIVGDVVWFRNIGTRTKPELSPAADVEVEWEGVQPSLAYGWYRPHHKANPKGLLTQWRTTPVMFDWNCDGLVDLVMLDHEGYLALFERRRKDGKLLLLPPRRVFADRDGRPLRLSQRPAGRSGRRKLALADMNGDGQVDLLADGVNVDIYMNLGVRNGVTCFANPMMAGARQLARHSTAPTTVDFNGDGRLELLVGAEDGYFYYLEIVNK